MEFGQLQLVKPVVPCVLDLGKGIQKGTKFIVNGVMTGGSFSINLHCGPDTFDDVALHFNPRTFQGEIVLNSSAEKQWEREERADIGPFGVGTPFSVKVTCKSEGFKINVNGCPMYLFGHRKLPQQIDHLSVLGDVDLTYIAVL